MDSDEEDFSLLSGLTAEVRGLKAGLKHRNRKRKHVEHYINEECPSRCLVRLYKKYGGKCSSEALAKDIFYLSPRQKYSDSDKGSNKLFS
jgi:hypothetical protein